MPYTQEEIDDRILQAEKAFTDKAHDQALSILNDIIIHHPDCATAYRKLGGILMQTEGPENALYYLKKAVTLKPQDTNNWLALGVLYKNQKKWSNALDAFQKSLQLSEGNVRTYLEAFQVYRILGKLENALSIIIRLLQIEPDNIKYRWEYAKLLNESGDKKKALQQYRSIIEKYTPNDPVKIVMEWYELMFLARHTKEACSVLEKLYAQNPTDAGLITLLATSYDDSGIETFKSLKLFEEAYGLYPNNSKVIYNLAKKYDELGRKTNAKTYYEKCLEIDPLETRALFALSQNHQFLQGDALFSKLEYAYTHRTDISSWQQTQLHYALGKAYDDTGDLKTAFEHYRKGGELHSQGKDQEAYLHLKDLTVESKKVFTKDFFSQNNTYGHQSKKAVFIIGMPRSGTTLIEQTLSSIDNVYGAGETYSIHEALKGMKNNGFSPFPDSHKASFNKDIKSDLYDRGQHYLSLLEALAPKESKVIIDKMPGNFMLLGSVHLLLPNAKIIHARRHPVETCLSAYRMLFARGQYWSDNLRTMGKYYRLYAELMEYWHNTLPKGTILDVRYEDMVGNLEKETKRMSAFIGVEWSPSCLEFHKTKRVVHTASRSQVSKPLYRTSMNRWKKYEPYLQPLLDEIGDLIKAYESEPKKDRQ